MCLRPILDVLVYKVVILRLALLFTHHQRLSEAHSDSPLQNVPAKVAYQENESAEPDFINAMKAIA